MGPSKFATGLLTMIQTASISGASGFSLKSVEETEGKSVGCSGKLAYESKSRETVRRLIELYSSARRDKQSRAFD